MKRNKTVKKNKWPVVENKGLRTTVLGVNRESWAQWSGTKTAKKLELNMQPSDSQMNHQVKMKMLVRLKYLCVMGERESS